MNFFGIIFSIYNNSNNYNKSLNFVLFLLGFHFISIEQKIMCNTAYFKNFEKNLNKYSGIP
jgi:hypothetical protein